MRRRAGPGMGEGVKGGAGGDEIREVWGADHSARGGCDQDSASHRVKWGATDGSMIESHFGMISGPWWGNVGSRRPG